MARHSSATLTKDNLIVQSLGNMHATVEGMRSEVLNSFRDMRTENSQQHAEGRRLIEDGLRVVHERVSTVAKTVEAAKEELSKEIKTVKAEAAASDDEIRSKTIVVWDKIKNKVLIGMGVLLVVLFLDKMGVKIDLSNFLGGMLG